MHLLQVQSFDSIFFLFFSFLCFFRVTIDDRLLFQFQLLSDWDFMLKVRPQSFRSPLGLFCLTSQSQHLCVKGPARSVTATDGHSTNTQTKTGFTARNVHLLSNINKFEKSVNSRLRIIEYVI